MTDNGLGDKIKGTAKETAGKVTGDKELEAEGTLDKATGAVKDTIADVGAGIKAAADKVKDAVSGDK